MRSNGGSDVCMSGCSGGIGRSRRKQECGSLLASDDAKHRFRSVRSLAWFGPHVTRVLVGFLVGASLIIKECVDRNHVRPVAMEGFTAMLRLLNGLDGAPKQTKSPFDSEAGLCSPDEARLALVTSTRLSWGMHAVSQARTPVNSTGPKPCHCFGPAHVPGVDCHVKLG